MPPMQSMFGGMRAAGQATTSQDPGGRDPSTESKDPSTGVDIDRVHKTKTEEPKIEGPVDVHRYRNGQPVKRLPTKPPKAQRQTWPIGEERKYKEPGSGYALGRDYIDAAKALKSRY